MCAHTCLSGARPMAVRRTPQPQWATSLWAFHRPSSTDTRTQCGCKTTTISGSTFVRVTGYRLTQVWSVNIKKNEISQIATSYAYVSK